MKKHDLLWNVSLIVICICNLIWFGSNIIGAKLPDVLIRVIGILDLICVAILAYTSVKKKRNSQ